MERDLPMTSRHTTRFGSLFAFSLVLSLVSSLSAADVAVDTAVALRPASEMTVPVSSPSAPSNPGYFDSIYTPDYLQGPPPASPTPVDDRQAEITARYQDSR